MNSDTNDKLYFESYDDVSVHESMLRDEVRTGTYRSAIMENRVDFEGKVVLDVGCGTGILSVFCAQAGAKKVYAVEASGMATTARSIAEVNGFANVIEVLNMKLEDVELPKNSVDVIISEWMGHFLVQESMLPSVLVAREKFLKPGGKMFPSRAAVYFAPFSDYEYGSMHVDFWRSLYGVKMTPLLPLAKACWFEYPQIGFVNFQSLVAEGQEAFSLDCSAMGPAEVKALSGSATFSIQRDCDMHGFASWFVVDFLGTTKSFTLSTAPHAEDTHWRQSSFYCEGKKLKKGETLCLVVNVQQVPDGRALRVNLLCSTHSDEEPKSLDYKIE